VSSWVERVVLRAKATTGLGTGVVLWGVIALLAVIAGSIFFSIAAFTWLANHYGSVVAGVALGCGFFLIALIAMLGCYMARSTVRKQANRTLSEHEGAALFDPNLLSVGLQIGRAIGSRRLLALLALLFAFGWTTDRTQRDPPDSQEK
jgi:hypothetical protein